MNRFWGWYTTMMVVASFGIGGHAATFVVSRDGDAGEGSLRWAIEQANENPGEDRIEFGVRGRIGLEGPLPLLTGDTVLAGPGVELLEVSGEGAGRVLSTGAGTLNTISGLRIANGWLDSGENGAGILNLGTLTLSNCVVSGNYASNGLGGGIYSRGDLTLVGTRVERNEVIGQKGEDGGKWNIPTRGSGAGGGSGGLGGGLFFESGRLRILDSIFSQNVAAGGAGGDMESQNERGGRGGGVLGGLGGEPGSPGKPGGYGSGGGGGGAGATGKGKYGGDGGVGGGGGGGSLPVGANVSLLPGGLSEFGGGEGSGGFNNPTQASAGPGGGGAGLGGAIFVQGGDGELLGCRFESNRVVGGRGGTEVRSRITGNSGGGYGGGVFADNGSLTIRECVFEGNVATSVAGGPGGGGGVFIRHASVDVEGTTWSGNSAIGAGGVGTGGEARGGGLMMWSGPGRIVNCTFSGNVALGGLGSPAFRQVVGVGGAASGGGLMVLSNAVEVVQGTVTRNRVQGGSNSGGDPNYFPTEKIADALGGGFANGQGRLTLRNSIVAGNWSQRTFEKSDGQGIVLSEGVNLIGTAIRISGLNVNDKVGVDPMLRPLAMNGGLTPTHALLTGSPAFNAAGEDARVTVDQRGVVRPAGPRADIGAVEMEAVIPGAVTIRIDGGVVVDGAEIRLAHTADLTFETTYANGTILYTLDGTTPTAESTLYTGPIRIAGSVTIRAMAYRRDFGESVMAGPVRVLAEPWLRRRLAVEVEGQGGVERDPVQADYGTGESVRLTAWPAPGWKLARWSGDGAGTETRLDVRMDGDKRVRAEFVPERLFQVSVTGVGPGLVSLVPAGGLYASNTVVGLVLTPGFLPDDLARGYVANIAGDILPLGADNSFVVTRDMNAVVTFDYDRSRRTPNYLQLETEAIGAGRVVDLTAYPMPMGRLKNRLVPLRADAEPGWTFRHWGADGTGTVASASFNMSRDLRVTAVFGTTVSVVRTGQGYVDMGFGGGKTTGWDPVRFTAVPAPGHYFVRWGDALSGERSPVDWVVREALPTVSALFEPLPSGEAALVMRVEGKGTVESEPAGNRHPLGRRITLVARPGDGERFVGWTGDVSGTANPMEVTLDASKTVTAVFTDGPKLSIQDPYGFRVDDLFRLQVEGPPGRRYRVERSTDLVHWDTWASGTALSRVNDVAVVSAGVGKGLYYRVVTEAP